MDFGVVEPSLRSIKAIAILDHDGKRIFAKYYDSTFSTLREQKLFENKLWRKTAKDPSEIILLDGITILFKANIDLIFYVMGARNENELLLMSVLHCIFDSCNTILKKDMNRKSMTDCMDLVMMAVDEICDQGVLLECDPECVVQRVGIRTDDLSLGDQAVSHVQARLEAKMAATSAALLSAKDQLKWSILK